MVLAWCLYISDNIIIDTFFLLFIAISTKRSNLDPNFITGFTDGEGCFNLSIYKESRSKTG